MSRLLAGAPAPTRLGTHLRAYTFGHVRQLDAVAARVLAALATCTPVLAGVGRPSNRRDRTASRMVQDQ